VSFDPGQWGGGQGPSSLLIRDGYHGTVTQNSQTIRKGCRQLDEEYSVGAIIPDQSSEESVARICAVGDKRDDKKPVIGNMSDLVPWNLPPLRATIIAC